MTYKSEEKTKMGLLATISLVVGLQLGSALFLLPSQLAVYGFWGALSWILTGTGAVCLSLIFSKLAETDRAVGGPSVYIEKAFGRRPAFYVAWAYWLISWLSSLPVLTLAVSCLEFSFVSLSPLLRVGVELSILIAIALLNLRGAGVAGVGEVVFATLKVIPWVILPLLCVPYWRTETLSWPVDMSPFHALNQASLLTFWGFVGLEAVTTLTNCVRRPSKTIPLALFFGTLLVMSVYFFNTTVLMGIVPAQELISSTSPYGLLLSKILGPWAGRMLSFIIAIMCLGTLNSWLLASGQIAFMAGESGLFPRFFSKTNKAGSPYAGILLTLGLMVGTLFLTKFQGANDHLNMMVNFSCSLFIVIYLLCVLALVRFIYTKQLQVKVSFKFLIAFCLLFCVWSLSTTPLTVWGIAALVPLSGGFIAWWRCWPVY